MNKADYYAKRDLTNMLNNGFIDENPRPKYSDGTPAHTISVNHVIRSFDLSKNEFPMMTLRPIYIKNAIREMLWIFQDQTNDLEVLRNKYNNYVWDAWESKDYPGTIGHRYGHTVKKYDLVNKLLNGLKTDPFGRRHIIDLYQYEEFNNSDGLAPCVFCSIWNVRKENNEIYLDMLLIQRSADSLAASLCGWNECQYSALMLMVARHCGYKVGVLTHVIGNEQIYDRHIEIAKELVSRESIDCTPKIVLNPDKKDFYEITIDDFTIEDYPIEKIKEQNPQIKLDLGI